MELKILALYPLVINALRGQEGVVLRRRRSAVWTQVECLVEARGDGRSFARPRLLVGNNNGRPTYRLRIELRRGRDAQDGGIAIPLQPASDSRAIDPEQRVIAPIFVSPEKVLFEFQRAEVLYVSPDGRAELRFAAVDMFSGEVGTKTLWTLDTKFVSLVARCEQHLGGLTDIFPSAVPRPVPRHRPIPQGKATLSFGAEATGHASVVPRSGNDPTPNELSPSRSATPLAAHASHHRPRPRNGASVIGTLMSNS